MQKKFLIAALLGLALAGCSSSGTLQSIAVGSTVSGTVTRGFIEPHRVEVTVDGKRYRGEWRTGVPTPEQRQATALPHQKHIGLVRSTLRADDGGQIDCRWQTDGYTGQGVCAGAGREYPMILK